MTKIVEPFVTPDLPASAPAWTRTWCTMKKPLARAFIENNEALLGMMREATLAAYHRDDELLSLVLGFPMHALCRVREGASLYTARESSPIVAFTSGGGRVDAGGSFHPFCKVEPDELVVVVSYAVSKSGKDPYVGVCESPVDCKTESNEHALARPEDLTVIGYWLGVTSTVMRALYEGRPFKLVRDMALNPKKPKYAQN